MKNFKLLATLLFCVVLISCQDDDNSTGNPDGGTPPPTSSVDISDNFGQEITRGFLGEISDENHNPISGVNIKVGSSSATTDANGVFVIKNANVHEHFAHITAKKSGYIDGSRSLIPTSGTNKVKIMMLSANVTGTAQSGSPKTISLQDGTSVDLPGDYVDENGNSYSGPVNVIMHHLNPENEDFQQQMPGMLYAATTESEERLLQSFGMLSVELRGDANQKLNLAEGSPAEIHVKLSSSLAANAPSTIPLWHFDQTKGYWIEDGEATLQNGEYVGMVPHFSFWNCDVPAEAIELCVSLNNPDGNPLNNFRVSLESDNYGSVNGYTNNSGEVCGLVPSNENLNLKVYNPFNCNDQTPIYTADIGPYSNDSSENISISSSEAIFETVTGNFTDCDGNPISSGYVQLHYANYDYTAFTDFVDDGTYSITLSRCAGDNTFDIQGYNFDDQQTSDEINYTFTTPLTQLGTLSACNATDEFVQYTIDDGESDEVNFFATDSIGVVFDPQHPQYDNRPVLNIASSNINSQNCFYMTGVLNSGTYLGTYDDYDYQASGDTGFSLLGECMEPQNPDITYTLSLLGNVGEYVDVNFSGNYEDVDGSPHTITGIVHAKRDQ